MIKGAWHILCKCILHVCKLRTPCFTWLFLVLNYHHCSAD